MVLKSANITKHQKMLVFTVIKFTKKVAVYQDTKQFFLTEFKEKNVQLKLNVKLECLHLNSSHSPHKVVLHIQHSKIPSHVAEHERELLNVGYVKQPCGEEFRWRQLYRSWWSCRSELELLKNHVGQIGTLW